MLIIVGEMAVVCKRRGKVSPDLVDITIEFIGKIRT
jgi:hypothetical protein